MTTLREHAAAAVDMLPHVETLTRLSGEAYGAVVEFGVRTGVSTWAILDGLVQDAVLYSVDIDASCHERVSERVRDDPRWLFIAGPAIHPATRGRLPGACNLVFIDTSHEYHATLEELALAADLQPARIALHDWELPDVRDAVEGFVRRDGRYEIEFVEPSQWGFVVLRRR